MGKEFKKKFLLVTTICTALSITACSNTNNTQSEIKENSDTNNEISMPINEEKLVDLLKGKYLHEVTEDEPGDILYFKDNKEIISIFSYHADIFNIKEVTSDKTSVNYRLETSEFGNPQNIINCTLNITKESNDTVSMTWIYDDGSYSSSNLKILSAKECVESIYKKYPNYKHDKDWNDLGLTDKMFNEVYSLNQESKNNASTKSSSNTNKENSQSTNKKQNTINEDKYKISEQKALEIVKSKLKGVLNTQYLKIGNNKYGMDKIVIYNDIKYYCIYWEDEYTAADYRFCVNVNTGEVFYEDVSALGKLTPINQYINSIKHDKEEVTNPSQSEDNQNKEENNTNEESMTSLQAIDICTNKLKNIGVYDDTYGKGGLSGESKEYYYITYECGETYAIDRNTKNVYYAVPAGDGLSGPL